MMCKSGPLKRPRRLRLRRRARRLGPEAMCTDALRRYFEKYRDAGPPYPTSLDLYAELRAATPDSLDGLLKAVREFGGYIAANRAFIPNYSDRYRHGETISTDFVESAVNQVISKRFVKKQQMRWSERGAHRLLQIRTQVLNDDWRGTLSRW